MYFPSPFPFGPIPIVKKIYQMHFLKKPDFLLADEEDIAQRQHQLQEYHLF